MIIHAGDLTYKGEKQEVTDFLEWFSNLKYEHKIFVAGNHDFYFEKASKSEIEKIVPKGVTYLEDSGIIINGLQLWGSPVTPWYFNWAFNRLRGAAIKQHWNLIPDSTNLLITHGPAFGIHDVVINGTHTGCKDLLKRINEVKPAVHVCGHIHEGYGQAEKNGTKFINASVLNESYELVNKPVVFEV